MVGADLPVTKKEATRQRERIKRIDERWRKRLGLDEWRMTYVYEPGSLIVDGSLDPRVVACAKVRWEYRTATLSFNLVEIAKLDDDDLEETYVHEAMHVLLNEMREYRKGKMKCEERVACSLSFAFMRLARGS